MKTTHAQYTRTESGPEYLKTTLLAGYQFVIFATEVNFVRVRRKGCLEVTIRSTRDDSSKAQLADLSNGNFSNCIHRSRRQAERTQRKALSLGAICEWLLEIAYAVCLVLRATDRISNAYSYAFLLATKRKKLHAEVDTLKSLSPLFFFCF